MSERSAVKIHGLPVPHAMHTSAHRTLLYSCCKLLSVFGHRCPLLPHLFSYTAVLACRVRPCIAIVSYIINWVARFRMAMVLKSIPWDPSGRQTKQVYHIGQIIHSCHIFVCFFDTYVFGTIWIGFWQTGAPGLG